MDAAPTAGRRLALLVGIDRYPNFGERAQLRGCVNDVRALEHLLLGRFAFRTGDVTRLENEEAGRDGILGALEALSRRAGPGDAVVVQFCGHGSRVRAPAEPSGWVETIVPADSGRLPHPNRDVTDRELGAWLGRLGAATRNVLLVFDSCFSGSILRDGSGPRSRWIEADPRPHPGPAAPRAPAQVLREVGPSGWLPLSDRYVLLAACRADEECFELRSGEGDGAHHGALSFYLCREIERARPEASHHEVFVPVAAAVTAAFPAQHPQLEGARERRIFAEGSAPGPRPSTLPERWGQPCLTIDVAGAGDGAEASRTLERIARSPLLTMAAGDEPAGARLALLPVRKPGSDGSSGRLDTLKDRVWVVLDGDGTLLVPVVRAARSGTIDRLIGCLESYARFRHLLELDDGDADGPLRGRIGLTLRRRLPGGGWADLGSGGGGIELDESDRVSVEITNRSPGRVFVGLLDFGLTGQIALLHPPPGGSQVLRPGASLRLGERPDEALELYIPEGFPFGAPSARGVAGTGHIKLFASTAETDFGALEQGGYPVCAEARPAAARRRGGAIPLLARGGGHWTAVTRSFVLRRRP